MAEFPDDPLLPRSPFALAVVFAEYRSTTFQLDLLRRAYMGNASLCLCVAGVGKVPQGSTASKISGKDILALDLRKGKLSTLLSQISWICCYD